MTLINKYFCRSDCTTAIQSSKRDHSVCTAGREGKHFHSSAQNYTSPSFTPSSPFAFKTTSALYSLLCCAYTTPYETRQFLAQYWAHRAQ